MLLGLAIGAATILAACSPAASSGSPSAPTAAPATVDGRTFVSTDIQGAILVPGTQVQLTFANGDLGASAGCNSIGGRYTIEGGRLRTAEQRSTAMGCDAPRMQQDQWLSTFLGDVGVSLAGDTLTLTDGRITLTLLDKEVAEPDKPLEGTRWVLDSILSGDAVSSVPAGVTASLMFAGDQMEIHAGCNTGSAKVAWNEDTLAVGPIALTKMACQGGPADVEQAVIGVLAHDPMYRIQGDVLTLDADGAGLIYRAAP
jgi:heat shock protein HslJ